MPIGSWVDPVTGEINGGTLVDVGGGNWSNPDSGTIVSGGDIDWGSGGAPSGGGSSSLPSWLQNFFDNPTSAGSTLGITGLLGVLAALNDKPQTASGAGSTTVALPQWYTDAQVAGISGAENLPKAYTKLGALNASGLTAEQQAALDTLSPIKDYTKDTSLDTPTAINDALLAAQGMDKTYTDKLAAGANANQKLGAGHATASLGALLPTLNDAKSAITTGGGSILDSGISKYMNPYLENVLNPQVRRLKEDQAQEQQAFDAARVSRGAFGSSRADLMKDALRERQGVTMNDLTSKAYEGAYNNATALSTADLARKAQEGTALGNLAQTTQGVNTQDIQNLMSTGGALQGIDQATLDKAYAEFQRQQAALPQQAQQLQSIGQTQFNMGQSGLDKDYQTWLNNQNATTDWTKYMTGLQAQTAGQGASNLMTENTAVNEFPFKQNAAQVAAVGALKPGSTATTTSTSTGPTAGALSNLAGTASMLWGLANPKGLGG